MHNQLIFSIYDDKAEAYLQPFILPAPGLAIRQVINASQATKIENGVEVPSDFNRYAADYTLFELGQWNEMSGQIEMYSTPRNLGTALQLRAQHRDAE